MTTYLTHYSSQCSLYLTTQVNVEMRKQLTIVVKFVTFIKVKKMVAKECLLFVISFFFHRYLIQINIV